MGFKMIYCTPMSGSYFLYSSNLEKCGNFWKNGIGVYRVNNNVYNVIGHNENLVNSVQQFTIQPFCL